MRRPTATVESATAPATGPAMALPTGQSPKRSRPADTEPDGSLTPAEKKARGPRSGKAQYPTLPTETARSQMRKAHGSARPTSCFVEDDSEVAAGLYNTATCATAPGDGATTAADPALVRSGPTATGPSAFTATSTADEATLASVADSSTVIRAILARENQALKAEMVALKEGVKAIFRYEDDLLGKQRAVDEAVKHLKRRVVSLEGKPLLDAQLALHRAEQALRLAEAELEEQRKEVKELVGYVKG